MIFHLVLHRHVADFLACGWVVRADLGDYHGQFAVMMQWLCDCPIRKPLL